MKMPTLKSPAPLGGTRQPANPIPGAVRFPFGVDELKSKLCKNVSSSFSGQHWDCGKLKGTPLIIRTKEVSPKPSHPITNDTIFGLRINVNIETINIIKIFENITFF